MYFISSPLIEDIVTQITEKSISNFAYDINFQKNVYNL